MLKVVLKFKRAKYKQRKKNADVRSRKHLFGPFPHSRAKVRTGTDRRGNLMSTGLRKKRENMLEVGYLGMSE